MIYVITHKKSEYSYPADYRQLLVGATPSLNPNGSYDSDAIGESISKKNSSYCELTGLYWMWKNTSTSYLGLVHYRRLFFKNILNCNSLNALTENELRERLPGRRGMIVAQRVYVSKEERTVRAQYEKLHNEHDLAVLRSVLYESSDPYLDAFDIVMNRSYIFPFNMFYGHRELVDDYCSWLFSILSKCESLIDISGRDAYQKRVFGFMAERLFNVWIMGNSIKVSETPVVQLDTTLANRMRFRVSQNAHRLYDAVF